MGDTVGGLQRTGTQEVKRLDLVVHHIVEAVDLRGHHPDESGVVERIGHRRHALPLEAGIASGGSERLGVHEHAVEIVIAGREVLHDGQGRVGTPLQVLEALGHQGRLTPQGAFLWKIDGKVQAHEYRHTGQGTPHKLPQRDPHAAAPRGKHALVTVGDGVVSVKCLHCG